MWLKLLCIGIKRLHLNKNLLPNWTRCITTRWRNWFLYEIIAIMELSRIYYWIWFCKNDSWKIYLNLCFGHNLAHVWHIFHIYENKNAPLVNKNGPETWSAAPRVVPLTVLKFFMDDFFILQIIWLLLTCWTSLCKWFTTYGSCKLSGQLVELDG